MRVDPYPLPHSHHVRRGETSNLALSAVTVVVGLEEVLGIQAGRSLPFRARDMDVVGFTDLAELVSGDENLSGQRTHIQAQGFKPR